MAFRGGNYILCDLNAHGLLDRFNILSSVCSFLSSDSFLAGRNLAFRLPRFHPALVSPHANGKDEWSRKVNEINSSSLGISICWSAIDFFDLDQDLELDRSFHLLCDLLSYDSIHDRYNLVMKHLQPRWSAADIASTLPFSYFEKLRSVFLSKNFSLGYSYISVFDDRSDDVSSICDIFIDDDRLIVLPMISLMSRQSSDELLFQRSNSKKSIADRIDSFCDSAHSSRDFISSGHISIQYPYNYESIRNSDNIRRFKSQMSTWCAMTGNKLFSVSLCDPDYKRQILDFVSSCHNWFMSGMCFPHLKFSKTKLR